MHWQNSSEWNWNSGWRPIISWRYFLGADCTHYSYQSRMRSVKAGPGDGMLTWACVMFTLAQLLNCPLLEWGPEEREVRWLLHQHTASYCTVSMGTAVPFPDLLKPWSWGRTWGLPLHRNISAELFHCSTVLTLLPLPLWRLPCHKKIVN